VPGLKYKAALSVAYGAGLRVSEVAIPGARFGCGASGDAPARVVVDERSSGWGSDRGDGHDESIPAASALKLRG